MSELRFINVLVDAQIHKEYKNLLRSRRKGERIKYILGDQATRFMDRQLKKNPTIDKQP